MIERGKVYDMVAGCLSCDGDDALGAQREGPGSWNSSWGTLSLGDLAWGNECMNQEWEEWYSYGRHGRRLSSYLLIVNSRERERERELR